MKKRNWRCCAAAALLSCASLTSLMGGTYAAQPQEDTLYVSDYLKGEGKDAYSFHNIDNIPLYFNRAVLGAPMKIHGKNYSKGVGMHSSSDNQTCLSINVEGLPYKSFRAEVGMQDEAWAQEVERNCVSFFVRVDGHVVANTDLMSYDDEAVSLAVSIEGAKMLELCLDYGATPYSDYANWGNARFSMEEAPKVQDGLVPSAELPDDAERYTLSNQAVSVSFAAGRDAQYITEVKNVRNGYVWLSAPQAYPLPSRISGKEVTWTYEKTEKTEEVVSTNEGDVTKTTYQLHYACASPKLSLVTSWEMCGGNSPVTAVTHITNESGATLVFSGKDVLSCNLFLTGPEDSELIRFNRSRMESPGDTYFKVGVLRDKTDGLLATSPVVATFNAPNGLLPYQMVQADGHGLYVGYDWSAGIMSFRSLGDDTGFVMKNSLNRSETVERADGQVFEVPGLILGAYCGDEDDGSNEMKNWFWDFEMTATLRENENEPHLELHVPCYSSGEWKRWLHRYPNVGEWGVELLKMDYDWTLHSRVFGNTTPVDWEPIPSKWKNGMVWTDMVKEVFPDALFSLYMPDTYLWGDLSQEEAREAQIAAIKQRVVEWGIDYWRSDFCVEGNCTYAEHEGLLCVLDTLISDPDIPQFRYEHCSSGGALKDFTTLRRMTFMTTEDWARALEHRQALYANSYMINPAQLKADLSIDWVPREDETADITTRNWVTYNYRTGLMGAFMVSKHGWYTDMELEVAQATWKLYTERQRPILRNCNVYHILPMPDGVNWDGLMYYNPLIEQGSVMLFKPSAEVEENKTILLKGLDSEALYDVEFVDHPENNARLSGEVLMNDGLEARGLEGRFASEVIFITKYMEEIETETETEGSTESVTAPGDDSTAQAGTDESATETAPVGKTGCGSAISSVALPLMGVGAAALVCKARRGKKDRNDR